MTHEEIYRQAVESGSYRPQQTDLHGNSSFDNKFGFTPHADGMVSYANTYGTDHAGLFSPNNPYLVNLRNAVGADKDALYELAVKWEADNATLQEQRAYEHPIEQVARQRAAGINVDVQAGQGVSSGSSAGLGEQDNTSSFGNTYADKQLELQASANKWSAVATIGGLATNIASLGASATQIFDTLSTLPARRKLANVQANIAEATQDDVIKSVGAGATSSILDNVNSSIGILSRLSTLVGPDATDEDMTNTFTALGMPKENIPQFVSGVNEFRKNPHVQQYYANGEKQLRATEAYNQHYTSEVIGRFITNDIAVRDMDFTLGIQSRQFQKSVQDYFMTDENALKTASLQSTSLDSGIAENVTSVADLAFMRDRIEHDVKAFARSIEDSATIYNESKRLCDDLRETIKSENRSATAVELAIMDSEYAKQMHIMGLTSNALSMQYSFLQHTKMNAYQIRGLTDHGHLMPNFLTNSEHTFMQNTFSFSDVVNGAANANSIASSMLNSLTSLGLSVATKKPTINKTTLVQNIK